MRAFLDEIIGAARGLARVPGFTALAATVLGLGLGATIFMYGVVDTLMLRPPPYPAAERIVTIGARMPREEHLQDSIDPHDFDAISEQVAGFEAIGAVYTGTVYLTGDGQAERYEGGFATAGLLEVAGVAPALGRSIEPADVLPGATPVVVLADDLWRSRYGADPSIIGRPVRLNGVPTTVVGIMPPGYSFPRREALWLPTRQDTARVPRHESVSVQVFGRMAPEADADQIQQQLGPVAARVALEDPDRRAGLTFEVVPYAAAWVGEMGRMLLLTLLAAVGFVLLIACANVSNLLLARAAYRVRESTVRAAVGATRRRLVMHVLAESFVIATLATLLGLLLASIGLDAMRVVMEQMADNAPPWFTYAIDARVAFAAILFAFLSMLLAGLPAAVRATRPSLDAVLRDGGRTGTGLAIGRIAWTLVVVEITLACGLLGGAALMTRGVLAVTNRDIGVETADIMTARVGMPQGVYPEPDEQVRFFERLLARLEAQPEIDSAAITQSLPMHGSANGPYEIEGRTYGEADGRPDTRVLQVSPSYFDTFRLPARAGRALSDADDADAMPVAVVNETFAATAFPGGSALGERVRAVAKPNGRWHRIVGVVPDVVQDDSAEVDPVVYVPLSQDVQRFASIAVRGPGDPATLTAAMRRALAETDPDLALYWIYTLDETIARQTTGIRIIGTIFAAFGVIALVLAAAGLFGVLAFHVGQRTREIGVRRALGADDGRILGMVLRASGTQVALGLALGMALLPLLGRVLAPVLPDKNPWDPLVYGGVLATMIVVSLAAALAPTLRALGIDPATALRYE